MPQRASFEKLEAESAKKKGMEDRFPESEAQLAKTAASTEKKAEQAVVPGSEAPLAATVGPPKVDAGMADDAERGEQSREIRATREGSGVHQKSWLPKR